MPITAHPHYRVEAHVVTFPDGHRAAKLELIKSCQSHVRVYVDLDSLGSRPAGTIWGSVILWDPTWSQENCSVRLDAFDGARMLEELLGPLTFARHAAPQQVAA